MVKACVFDMDGLLLDSERQVYSRGGLEISAELGRPVSLEFLTSLMGGSWDNYRESFLREYGADYPIDEYLDRFWKRAHHIINNVGIPLRPHALDILDYCRKQGIRMAIATSSHRIETMNCLKNAKIMDYFDCVVTADDVEKTKPDPGIFHKAIESLGYSKEETLVLEDGHNGAQAAFNGNCRLILVEDLAYLSEEDRQQAELHCFDLSEVIEFIRKENETTPGV